MKKIVFVILVFFSVSTFAKTAELIDMESGFDAKGIISIDEVKGRVENGTHNGVPYSISLRSGAALFEGEKGGELIKSPLNWSVTCLKDPITDGKGCGTQRGNLRFLIYSSMAPSITIGANQFPGSEMSIRIDSNSPITGTDKGFSESQNKEIFKQLSAGKKVVTRYKKWPNKENLDEEFELHGFNEVLEYTKWAVTKIK